jgi:cation transport regulator ChaB
VAYDTEFDNVANTALEFDEVLGLFNRLTSRRKVLILACCHSGMGKSELPEEIKAELSRLKSGFFVKPLETASEASVIIGVSSWGETAQEDPKLKNDIYTHFFLEGMKDYDRNRDGAVSISEAHDFAQRKTYYYTKGKQRPFTRSDILGTDHEHAMPRK